MDSKLKLIVMPSIVEACEGCNTVVRDGVSSLVKDFELRNGTRQIARAFLCPGCAKRTAHLLAEGKTQ